MWTCENDYGKAFHALMNGKTHTFDCFERALQLLLAQACAHCGCCIIGQGVERDQVSNVAIIALAKAWARRLTSREV